MADVLFCEITTLPNNAGVCEKAWIEDEKVMATIRFSRNRWGQELLADMKDLISRNVSIGYSVDRIPHGETL